MKLAQQVFFLKKFIKHGDLLLISIFQVNQKKMLRPTMILVEEKVKFFMM